MVAKSATDNQTATTQEIARIRDILLGPQIRETDQRFQQLTRDIERLQQDIQRLTEQLHEQAAAQSQSLDHQVTRLQGDLADLDF